MHMNFLDATIGCGHPHQLWKTLSGELYNSGNPAPHRERLSNPPELLECGLALAEERGVHAPE
jgi:hypothetical protein